jgi:hypothetical protein
MLFPETLLRDAPLPEGVPSIDEFRKSRTVDQFLPFFDSCEDVVDYRDVAEDLLERYGITCNFAVPRDNRKRACAELVLSQMGKAADTCLPYKDYALQHACSTWLQFSDPSMTLRPRIRLATDKIETVLTSIEAVAHDCTYAHLTHHLTVSGVPILASLSMLYCMLKGIDVDDTFVLPPKTSVRGNLCVLRDTSSETVSLKSCKKQSPDLKRFVLSYDGHLLVRSGDTTTKIVEPCAKLVVPVPGLDVFVGTMLRRYAIVAKDSTAAVLALTFDGTSVKCVKRMEIDLGEPADFIDCQRDRDDNIVFFWGQRNALTGGASVQLVAWTEEDFLSKTPTVNVVETHKVPNRMTANARVDYRDHGNLLSLVTDVTEVGDAYSVTQRLLFGRHILENTLLAPGVVRKYHVYGSPLDFVEIQYQAVVYKTTQIQETTAHLATGFAVWFG